MAPEVFPQVIQLGEKGASIHAGSRNKARKRIARLLGIQSAECAWLARTRPDYVVISMGWHLDDLSIAHDCRELGVPYALLVQAASPFHWIGARLYERHRLAFSGASACFFVSSQNRDVLEANLAIDLSSSRIVDNAFAVDPDTSPNWPSGDIWRLACVGQRSSSVAMSASSTMRSPPTTRHGFRIGFDGDPRRLGNFVRA